jgi:hypothetical protein
VALQSAGVPKDTARRLLRRQGHGDKKVVPGTGPPKATDYRSNPKSACW